MRTLRIYCAVVLLFCGCSLLTKTVKTTNKDIQEANLRTNLKATTGLDKTKSMQYLYRGKDSMMSAYQIQLWPKGKIVFNESFGFEGEFDSILMKGNLGKLSTLEAATKIDQQDKSKIGLDLIGEARSRSENKTAVEERFPNYVLIIICGLVLATALFFIIRSIIK